MGVLKSEQFLPVIENPDFVLSVGGDGTFLIAERQYPGIPKILIRESKICKNCHDLSLHTMLRLIKNKAYTIKEHPKLTAKIGEKRLIATNDIVLRNKLQTSALRFSLAINGNILFPELIGDGLVIATPFGSNGYFHSITTKHFQNGIGIAFNNITKKVLPLFLKEKDTVHIVILRMEGFVSADNNPQMVIVKRKDAIRINILKEKMRLIVFEKKM